MQGRIQRSRLGDVMTSAKTPKAGEVLTTEHLKVGLFIFRQNVSLVFFQIFIKLKLVEMLQIMTLMYATSLKNIVRILLLYAAQLNY